jgi:hypothetical protein
LLSYIKGYSESSTIAAPGEKRSISECDSSCQAGYDSTRIGGGASKARRPAFIIFTGGEGGVSWHIAHSSSSISIRSPGTPTLSQSARN